MNATADTGTAKALARSLRSAVIPVLTCLATLGALTAWTSAGNAGRPRGLEVSQGRIFTPLREGATSAFFTIRNTGEVTETLTGVTTARGTRAMLSRNITTSGGARSMRMVPYISVPPRSTLRMSPFALNVMVTPHRRSSRTNACASRSTSRTAAPSRSRPSPYAPETSLTGLDAGEQRRTAAPRAVGAQDHRSLVMQPSLPRRPDGHRPQRLRRCRARQRRLPAGRSCSLQQRDQTLARPGDPGAHSPQRTTDHGCRLGVRRAPRSWVRTNASRRCPSITASSSLSATPSSNPGRPRGCAFSTAASQSSAPESRGRHELARMRSATARRAMVSSHVRAEDLPSNPGRLRSARR